MKTNNLILRAKELALLFTAFKLPPDEIEEHIRQYGKEVAEAQRGACAKNYKGMSDNWGITIADLPKAMEAIKNAPLVTDDPFI